ncbi:hypothetical protein [Segnochrobactrum spirostomi]|uniref:Uncharacterized protein n=1 Tax=Segnochrobactrum spirostomi TaxID=2608987 RepID=A0A6A7Y3E8_9HYPH|nr:hypothetical protein [Segnochrobactrum spirostomi]MQT13640.1 hypothetical protein [Segnochrobactrum spirostomi]
MMFTLVDRYLFWWPCSADVPDEARPGKFNKQSFKLRFEALPRSEAQGLAAELAALDPDEREKREHELLYRVVHDWSEVVDAQKEPVPFERDTFARALEWSWFRTAAYRGLTEALEGGPRGN